MRSANAASPPTVIPALSPSPARAPTQTTPAIVIARTTCITQGK